MRAIAPVVLLATLLIDAYRPSAPQRRTVGKNSGEASSVGPSAPAITTRPGGTRNGGAPGVWPISVTYIVPSGATAMPVPAEMPAATGVTAPLNVTRKT